MRKTALFLLFSAAALAQTGATTTKQQDDQPDQTAKPKTDTSRKARSKKTVSGTRTQQNPAQPNAMPVNPKTPIEPSAPRTPVAPTNPTQPADPTHPTTVKPPTA